MRKFKKVTAMVCALMMSAMLFAALPVGAAEQVTNGDFESVDVNGNAEGWTLSGTGEVVTDGENNYFALGGLNASITSSPIDVEAGGTYSLKFKKNTPGDQLRVYFRWYKINKETNKETEIEAGNPLYNGMYPAGTNGEWAEQTYVRTAPEGAEFLRFYFITHKYAEGTTPSYIDDVTVTRVDNQQGELLENGSLDVIENGAPKGFTGGTVESSTVHTAGGKALKLENTEAGATQTVKAKFLGTTGKRIEVAAYMNLTALDASADGVMLEVYDGTTQKAATSYFKSVNDANGTPWGWRKMMLTFTGVAKELEIRVTLSGIGIVYLDDFSAVTSTNLIINGDMEGLQAEHRPTGWTLSTNTGTWGNEIKVTREATGNFFVSIGAKTTVTDVEGESVTTEGAARPFLTRKISLTQGIRYKLHVRYMVAKHASATSIGNGALIYFAPNLPNGYTHSSMYMPRQDGVWQEYTLYFTPNETKEYTINLTKRSSDLHTISYDDVSLEPVSNTHALAFYDADGNETEELEKNKTFTVKYSGFGEDYTVPENNTKVQLMIAKYKKIGEKITLEEVTIDNTEIPYAQPVKLKTSSSTTASLAGEVPLELSMEVTVPAEGEYVYKAFAWDKDAPLTNITAAAKLQ